MTEHIMHKLKCTNIVVDLKDKSSNISLIQNYLRVQFLKMWTPLASILQSSEVVNVRPPPQHPFIEGYTMLNKGTVSPVTVRNSVKEHTEKAV